MNTAHKLDRPTALHSCRIPVQAHPAEQLKLDILAPAPLDVILSYPKTPLWERFSKPENLRGLPFVTAMPSELDTFTHTLTYRKRGITTVVACSPSKCQILIGRYKSQDEYALIVPHLFTVRDHLVLQDRRCQIRYGHKRVVHNSPGKSEVINQNNTEQPELSLNPFYRLPASPPENSVDAAHLEFVERIHKDINKIFRFVAKQPELTLSADEAIADPSKAFFPFGAAPSAAVDEHFIGLALYLQQVRKLPDDLYRTLWHPRVMVDGSLAAMTMGYRSFDHAEPLQTIDRTVWTVEERLQMIDANHIIYRWLEARLKAGKVDDLIGYIYGRQAAELPKDKALDAMSCHLKVEALIRFNREIGLNSEHNIEALNHA